VLDLKTLVMLWMLSILATTAAAQDGGGVAGGGPVSIAPGNPALSCITPAERLEARTMADMFRASPDGAVILSRGASDGPPFAFYPQAGVLYRDLHHNNYVDLDPGPAIRDFECTDHTYNGHDGHDSGLRSFSEQEIGVPVYAVADGVVVARADGRPDRNTEWMNQPANYVVIDHGDGWETLYWHLKNGSVQPIVGDSVEAGEQIGLTASSGNSTGPHLHFEVQRFNASMESLPGACFGGNSLWKDPWAIDRAFRIRDFGFVRGDMNGFKGPPFEFPRSNHATFDDTRVSYWITGMNIPADTTYRFRFFTPSGRLDYDSGERLLGFTSGAGYRRFWARWWWSVVDMRNESGEWTVEIYLNEELEVTVPLRVFPGAQEPSSVNRPPAPVAATIFPSEPEEDDVLWARISPDLIHDDPDFDVVRYTYRWMVDGKVVREITSAAHSDALPPSFRGPGAVVTCEVAASDGVIAPCAPDVSGDRAVNLVDLAIVLAAWDTADGDVDRDGTTSASDLAMVIAEWGACP
jgi:hypothetical protein